MDQIPNHFTYHTRFFMESSLMSSGFFQRYISCSYLRRTLPVSLNLTFIIIDRSLHYLRSCSPLRSHLTRINVVESKLARHVVSNPIFRSIYDLTQCIWRILVILPQQALIFCYIPLSLQKSSLHLTKCYLGKVQSRQAPLEGWWRCLCLLIH